MDLSSSAAALLAGDVPVQVRHFPLRGGEKLLELVLKARLRRGLRRLSGTVSAIYWLVVTALFLICSFGPSGNGNPRTLWWIWAVAGVLFGAVMAVIRLTGSREK